MGLEVFARVCCAMWSLPKTRGEIPQGFGLTAPQIVNRLTRSVLGLFQLKPNQVGIKKSNYFRVLIHVLFSAALEQAKEFS